MTQIEASLPTDRTPATLHEQAEEFVLDTVTETGAEGVVLALDGSVETARTKDDVRALLFRNY